MLVYFVRGLDFPVPRPSEECPDHKARVRLSPSCFPCSHVWLHSDSASFSTWVFPAEIAVAEISHGIKVLLHSFCSTWLVWRRRTLWSHYLSDFWGVSKINSSWPQVPCTDGLLALWWSESSPNWVWISRQLSDQAWLCSVNLPACRVTQSRNQADRIAGYKANGIHNPSPNFGGILLGWMSFSVHKCTATSMRSTSLQAGCETPLCILHLPT